MGGVLTATWTLRGDLMLPDTLDETTKTAIAQAYVTVAGLETLDNELLMFEKSPALGVWGGEATQQRIGTALTPELAAAVKAALSDAGLLYIEQGGELVDTNDPARLDGDTITLPLDWQQSGATYSAGMVARHNGQLYECNQAHTTQGDPNWAPDIAAALWKPYLLPGEAREWRQPLGAHDAYPIGARVLWADTTWVNTIPANVWEPGVTGWTDENAAQTEAWAAGVAYTGDNTAGAGNGDVVTYNGRSYRCLQSHTSISTWTPAAVPALWLDLGPV